MTDMELSQGPTTTLQLYSYILATRVMSEVPAVSSQSKQLVTKKRGDIAVDGLNDRHDEEYDENNPLVEEEDERFWIETRDDCRSHAHS